MDKKTFIGDIVDMSKLKKDEFNLIASGCGTGKSYFVAHNLLNHFKDIHPSEVIFLTSRAITVAQQSRGSVKKLDTSSSHPVKFWRGELDKDEIDLERFGIKIMTYDKIIRILVEKNNVEYECLSKVKIVIVDECHALFSDSFIQNIEALKVWIRSELYKKGKIFLGLTATPKILKFYKGEWGVKVNQINDDILINYKVNRLICSDYDSLAKVIGGLLGKTIIMCNSISKCYELQKELPGSAVLVSKNNDYYSNEMDSIRNAIVNDESLPDTFEYPLERDYKGRPTKTETRRLNILITTSTLREGINLKPESGVRNVVSCFTDELHIIQFLGRCRFDIETLVVVDTSIRSDNFNQDSYLYKCRRSFKKYLKDKNSSEWLDGIKHVIADEAQDVEIYQCDVNSNYNSFIDFINSKWLAPNNETKLKKYRIYKESDRDEIVKFAIKCKLFPLPKRLVTFNRVILFLKDSLGYNVTTGRMTVKNEKVTYKFLTKNLVSSI